MMHVFPEISTERLNLRKLSHEDFPSLVEFANNRSVSDRILNIPHPYREPDAALRMGYVVQGFKSQSRYIFAIALKATNAFIGEISLHLDHHRKLAQLAYWIGEPHWANGYTTEACSAILQFGFGELKLEKIYAECHPENLASIRVLEKSHMQKSYALGKIVQYSITRPTYNSID